MKIIKSISMLVMNAALFALCFFYYQQNGLWETIQAVCIVFTWVLLITAFVGFCRGFAKSFSAELKS